MKNESYFGVLDPTQKINFIKGVRFYLDEIKRLEEIASPEEIYEGITDLVDTDIKATLKTQKVSCIKGCSFCCYLHVDITSLEAKVLQKHISPEMLPKLERQAKLTLETWRTIPYQQRKCVFLKNGECSVYEDRPIACRKYLVVSKPKLCNTEFKARGVLNVGTSLPEMIMSAIAMRYKTGSMAKLLLNK